ncbi:hypothetical protein ACTM8V_06745 [Holdemanella porci]
MKIKFIEHANGYRKYTMLICISNRERIVLKGTIGLPQDHILLAINISLV